MSINVNVPEEMLPEVYEAIGNKMNKNHNGHNINNAASFPTDIFPFKIQKFIQTTNSGLNFHPDYTASAIFFTTAVAIGNTYVAEVKSGWIEHVTSYFCLVGRPGANKSHPLSFCLAPIFSRDKHLFSDYQKLLEEFKYTSSLSKTERQEQGLEVPNEPILKKHIVSDITAEAIGVVHKNNKRGLGLYSDELAAWVKNFGRYNSGSDMEFWLSNFSGKLIMIDRKGSASIRIDHPSISVSGTIQPGVLQDFSKDNRTENGFLDRILFAYPEDDKKTYWSETEVDKDTVSSYNKIIERLLDDNPLSGKSNHITFCPIAFELLKQWQKENTDRINKEENEYIASIYTKLEIYCIRLSLILQMLRYACNETSEGWQNNKCIEEVSVLGAIKAISYFEHTARKVYRDIHEKNIVDRLPGDKRKFYENLPEIFKTEKAIALSKQFGIAERTLKRFLKETKFFKQIKHGVYEKVC